MIIHHINHDHPAARAAAITSEAMKRVYHEARIGTQASCSRKQRREALAALALSERVHVRVNNILKATPEAWIAREVPEWTR